MEVKPIESLKPGEFFTLRPIDEPNPSQVFIRQEYERSFKSYWAQRFSDINDGRYIKRGRLVYVGFTF